MLLHEAGVSVSSHGDCTGAHASDEHCSALLAFADEEISTEVHCSHSQCCQNVLDEKNGLRPLGTTARPIGAGAALPSEVQPLSLFPHAYFLNLFFPGVFMVRLLLPSLHPCFFVSLFRTGLRLPPLIVSSLPDRCCRPALLSPFLPILIVSFV